MTDERADELESLAALGAQVKSVFVERGLTLGTAESCTGGLVGYAVTEISGSSDFYVGGVISYSNEVKETELGVSTETLERYGAVSEQTCLEMAEGVRQRLGASVGLAVTGIAGPTGGSDTKPVGLTYVGIADAGGHVVRRDVWTSDRHGNRLLSARACLELLLARVA